jgi:ATP-binding cassette, subfamily B (MDR/TAP), member 1
MLTEVITNIKSIMSYCYEQESISRYQQKLEEIKQQQFKKKIISGLLFGLTYFIMFLVFGLIFYLSAVFISNYDLLIIDSFSAAFLIIFGGLIAGYNIRQIPDLGLLKPTTQKLFAIMRLKDED